MALVARGLDTLEELAQRPAAELEKLLSKPVATRLRRRVRELLFIQEVQPEATADAPPADGPTDAEAPQWSEEYPPADAIGQVYLSDAKVAIYGRTHEGRYQVLVDGKEAWLTDRSFETLLRLSVAAKLTDLGWLSYDRIDPDSYHQIVRRLKADLKAHGVAAENLVENSRAKSYRLSVPPANIAIYADVIKRHFPPAVSILAPLYSRPRT